MRVLRVSHSAVVDAWRERERRLAPRGIEVTTLCAESWNEGGAEVSLRPRPGERVRGVRTLGTHPALFVYDPRPLWSALKGNWDAVELHEEPFALATAEILALRALRRQRAPYSLYSAQNIAKRYPVPFRWLERWALRHASGLSVCNRAAGEICAVKGFPGVPRVIPLGLDRSAFRPGTPRVAPGRPVVGYAGRLASHKGVEVLLDADGVRARVAWPFPSPWGTWLEAIGLGRLRRRPDFVIGSVLLLRAEALEQAGGLDERFFLYAEETDWARRASLLGWRHRAVESVTAVHLGAATSSDGERREAHFHASQERYIRKHFGALGWQIARAGQVAGASVRSLVLRGELRRAARRRAVRYVRGPVRGEVRFRTGET